MKFCKNLQRVVDISDPEWAPYWTNYKMLKKLIKELPSLVPSDDGLKARPAQRVRAASVEGSRAASPSSVDSYSVQSSSLRQHHGDKTTEAAVIPSSETSQPLAIHADTQSSRTDTIATSTADGAAKIDASGSSVGFIGKSPGEVAFFKLLHTELQKATHFFARAEQEFVIREERVREGMKIMKQPNSIMVSEKWSLLAKSLYRLYKDLLLLETFAIMTYCSFSKILKKHDKVTGYDTRRAFMANVVNNANFTNYPLVMEMISRCEHLYEEVSEQLLQEGKQGLFEDERLFINMIHRLNEQCLDTPDAEGVPARKEVKRSIATDVASFPGGRRESPATSTLRSLVEDNDKNISLANVSEGAAGDECDDCDDCSASVAETSRKRPVPDETNDESSEMSKKRLRPDMDAKHDES